MYLNAFLQKLYMFTGWIYLWVWYLFFCRRYPLARGDGLWAVWIGHAAMHGGWCWPRYAPLRIRTFLGLPSGKQTELATGHL